MKNTRTPGFTALRRGKQNLLAAALVAVVVVAGVFVFVKVRSTPASSEGTAASRTNAGDTASSLFAPAVPNKTPAPTN
jgi:hypothetical protein